MNYNKLDKGKIDIFEIEERGFTFDAENYLFEQPVTWRNFFKLGTDGGFFEMLFFLIKWWLLIYVILYIFGYVFMQVLFNSDVIFLMNDNYKII